MHHLTGKKFGRLTALRRDPKKYSDVHWICKCLCGKTTSVVTSFLISGHTRSCGCMRRDAAKKMGTATRTHGEGHGDKVSVEYMAWRSMLDRCRNKNNSAFKHYGGRGIRTCRRWHKFENFLADVGRRPSKKHSLERVKNNQGYKPSNVQWATWSEQANNKRTSKRITISNRKSTVSQWAKLYNITASTLRGRIMRGWKPKDAVLSPVKPHEIFLTIGGITKNMSDWAKTSSVSRRGLAFRIRSGWSLRDAITKPSRNRAQRRK